MSDVKQLVEFYRDFMRFHSDFYMRLQDLTDEIRESLEPKRCADASYVLKSCIKYAKDLAREMDNCSFVIQRIGCLVQAQKMDADPIHGELATGTPDITHVVSIPNFKKNREECIKLMKNLGVPDILCVGGAVRPHWPAMVQALSDRITSGTPLPEGIDGKTTYPKYSINTRARRGVDLDALAAELEN